MAFMPSGQFPIVDDENLLKYEGNFPRYTSYPTAPHFNNEINDETVRNWLTVLPKGDDISLYFHVPFCKKMCWFCGCYTKITQRYAPVEDYAYTMMREIKIVGDILRNKGHKVSHIHFGGGSPTILLPDTFNELMKVVRESFKIKKDAEIAIEIDPRNVNEEKITAYTKAGVNRASLGVQDFNHDVQVAINREQSFELVYDCIKTLRKHDINNINLDLIYGLPKQTVEGVAKNVDYALLLNPDRIALFAYAHVQWMKKHQRMIEDEDLPDNLTRIKMYKAAAAKFKQKCYVSIGLDHFVKRSDNMTNFYRSHVLKRNFQGYSTDSAHHIIGFGVSSIGFAEQFGYMQNILDFDEYKNAILSEKLPVRRGIKINQEDIIRKYIIDQIMCYLEVNLNTVCKNFSLDKNHFDKEINSLKKMADDGLVDVDNGVITINPEFPQVTRIVSSIFDQYFKPEAAKHSKVT